MTDASPDVRHRGQSSMGVYGQTDADCALMAPRRADDDMGEAVVHEPSGLLELDAENRVIDANLTLQLWVGLTLPEILGQTFGWLLHDPEPTRVGEESLPGLVDLRSPDGSPRPVIVAFGEPTLDGRRFVSVFDAQAQLAFAQRLQNRHALVERTQNRLELVLSASVAFADATTEPELADTLAITTAAAYAAEEATVFLLDEQGRAQQVAGSSPFDLVDSIALMERVLGLGSVVKVSGAAAAYGVSEDLGHAFERAGVQSVIAAPIHLRDQQFGVLAAFFHHPRQFDEQATPLADALSGQAARAISSLRLQSRLAHAAMHDDTTGLPNRRLLENDLDALLLSRDSLLAVMFVDLDGFKNVNDSLGHQVGDEILRAVAARLRASVRDGDLVARYGGDEFVVVCQVADELGALDMAERIRESVSATYAVLPAGMTIGASVGVSVTPLELAPERMDHLVRTADQAMYRAKNAGGNQVARAGAQV